MKFFKKLVLTILVILIFGFLFRGWIYRKIISYESIGKRNEYFLENNDLKENIRENDKEVDTNIENIIKKSLNVTSNTLSFSFSKCENNPNRLIETRKGNCIGYANFFALICNQLIEKNGLSKTWKAKAQIGHLKLFGNDVHKYFNSPFFKDHDFVIIENSKTNEIYAVDPTINDYLYIDYVKLNR